MRKMEKILVTTINSIGSLVTLNLRLKDVSQLVCYTVKTYTRTNKNDEIKK